jgi:hypothetical protein
MFVVVGLAIIIYSTSWGKNTAAAQIHAPEVIERTLMFSKLYYTHSLALELSVLGVVVNVD